MSTNLLVQLAAAVGLTAGLGLQAQTVTDGSGSSSPTYFSASKTNSDGGTAQSATYALSASIGEAAPASAGSATYALTGGFTGTLDVVSTAPWITAARPIFHPPRNSKLVWLSGSRLDLGSVNTVTIGGQPGTIVAKSPTDIAVRLPNLLPPGWHQVTYTNRGGTTSLERGLGILPMIYAEGAPAANKSFDIVYKGTPGDIVFWAIAFNDGPKFQLGSFLHGITLSLAFFRVLPSFRIPANSDEFRFPVPPAQFGITVFLQGLFIPASPSSPYHPGSFSNMLKF